MRNLNKVPNQNLKIAGLSRSAVSYKPLRDAIGHTSLITEIAKKQLTVEYENIKARVAKLLKQIDQKKDQDQ